ncbi:hypothetical protein ACTMTI_40860 [Nonomuraea sp. H19]|uniref:hypothetical protein n=1 Tax=Nonomuraea sp. H19 TaxID=3452206 RepID=UPI003F88B72B
MAFLSQIPRGHQDPPRLTVREGKVLVTACNAVNGLHTATDPELIEGVFREEFGFTGFVMTDWNSYDTCDVVDMIAGGNNWLTPGGPGDTHTRQLEKAVTSGRLPEARLRESATFLDLQEALTPEGVT